MPPKKKVTASDGAEAEGGPFRWTAENERKLLVLIQGRYLTTEDYERLVSVFPGTNFNGVKIKVSRFRVEQRKLYDEYCWVLPEGGAKHRVPATPGSTTKSTKKRNADDLSTAANTPAPDTPSKKPRARKTKQSDAIKKETPDSAEEMMSEDTLDHAKVVKEEEEEQDEEAGKVI